ncbi:MAG: glycosyltransferase [bacterium]|nr:glycosyltransferase [bacterium]
MDEFDHGIPDNPYNKHAWVLGNPQIGDRVWIGAFCLIDAFHATLKIGRGTDISSGAQILTHTTVKRAISEHRHGEVDSAPTEIGEFCFIGTNATILMGAVIGHHSVVGAGAVVPQFMVVPPYSIVSGVPARIIGSSKKLLNGVEKESLSVVIPAYNEVGTIESVVKDVSLVLKKIKIDYEIVLVDDGSTDGTGKIIDKLSRSKNIRAVHHKKNKGFTGAIRTSFSSARKHLIFLAPADGQFDFQELPKFIDAIRGYDVVTAYIVQNEEAVVKKFKNGLFHLPFLFLSRYLLGITLREFSSVSLWRRRVFESVEIESEDRSAMFLPELISKALKKNYKFTQIPIKWYKRKGGEPKGTRSVIALKTLFVMVRLWLKSRN